MYLLLIEFIKQTHEKMFLKKVLRWVRNAVECTSIGGDVD